LFHSLEFFESCLFSTLTGYFTIWRGDSNGIETVKNWFAKLWSKGDYYSYG